MNKTELIAIVAEKANISKKDASAAVDAVVGAITDTLVAGDKVQIAGLGSFEVRERAARMGRNPATGEKVQLEATKNIGFKAAAPLKAAVKGN